MKKENSIIRNIKYFGGISIKRFPCYLPLNFIKIIFVSVKPFLNIIVSKMIIDELLGDKSLNYLITLVLVLVIGNVVLDFLISLFQIKINLITDLLSKEIEKDLNRKSMELNYEYLDEPKICDMAERASLSMSRYTQGFSENISIINNIISNIIIFGGIISIIIVMKIPILILISVMTVVINILIEKLNNKAEIKSNEENTKISRKYGYYFYHLLYFNNAKDIRLYNCQPKVRENCEEICGISNSIRHKLYNTYSRTATLRNISKYILENLLSFIILIVKVAEGAITIAEFTMLWTSISTFTSAMTTIFSNYQRYKKVATYQNKYIDFMELPLKEREGKLIPENEIKEIEFRNVSFKYPRSGNYVLKDFNLRIRKGERLSIVGLNGSGKTTIVKLLCRLYDIDEGEILLNGVNIKDYDYNEFIKLFSVVFQDFKIISFSVKENVAIIDENEGKLNKCLERAGVLERIRTLPKREKTFVNKWFDAEGVEFSGGEMQKLAIARALYKEGNLVILDEPTAALDPVTEAEIYFKFNSIIGDNKTTIFISHRLSSCKFCDRIIVLDNQVIVEEGTHEELMGFESGFYKKMFNAQAEYYKP